MGMPAMRRRAIDSCGWLRLDTGKRRGPETPPLASWLLERGQPFQQYPFR